jgi:hypothetical protein
MNGHRKSTSERTADSNGLMLGAGIVALALLAFWIGYGGGREIGSVLFTR